jgi:hypothetical protein
LKELRAIMTTYAAGVLFPYSINCLGKQRRGRELGIAFTGDFNYTLAAAILCLFSMAIAKNSLLSSGL